MLELLPPGGTVRKLWLGEADAYRDHLLRLDLESRCRRFSGGVGDDFIVQHARSIGAFGVVVYGFFLDGALRGAAELRPAAPFAREAEAAFSIERPWQSLGVGSVLLERLLLTARNRGITALQMHCLAENRRMQQLARKFEAYLKFDFGDVIAEVDPPRFTGLSLLREWSEDAFGMFSALFDAQSRVVRAD
ncbi:MAG TPA: GNAT family N-acetyltransferase [Pseudolabrys sp.]|nr:GNAT family N-acetyltransferase [Pseudolabrys sp.]